MKDEITNKLQQFLKAYSRVQKENDRLKDELQKAKDKEILMQQQLEEVFQQVSILKLGNSNMNEKDKKEFERKVNRYIKEIDKCISFLSE